MNEIVRMLYTGSVPVEVKGLGKVEPFEDGILNDVEVPATIAASLSRDPYWAILPVDRWDKQYVEEKKARDKREKKKEEPAKPVVKKDEPGPVQEKGGKK